MTFAAGYHIALLVVDLRPGISKREQIRYYETLTTMSEPCLHKAHAIVDEDFLMRPPLDRTNASIRQPIGSNLCGWYVMTYLEMEVAMLTGQDTLPLGGLKGPCKLGVPGFRNSCPMQKEIDMKKKDVDCSIGEVWPEGHAGKKEDLWPGMQQNEEG